MELRVEDRTVVKVEKGDKAVFGRGNGFETTDQTVSRRHVMLELDSNKTNQTGPTMLFEVVGRNPVWVRKNGGEEVRVFRNSEKGEVADGDWLCVSGKRPVWFKVRNVEERVLESDWEGVDVSGIDPVKEFGFIVMGHEFDQYPKKMIRNFKDWNWFLEEPRKESDDDDDEHEGKGKKGGRKKRKKSDDDDNEEWTGDAEVDEELVAKLRKVNKPKYSTRSKSRREPHKKSKGGKSFDQKMTAAEDEKDDTDEEDDETLGGFIVGEDDLENKEDPEGTDAFEDEEEEFVEDDDDDDDDE